MWISAGHGEVGRVEREVGFLRVIERGFVYDGKLDF